MPIQRSNEPAAFSDFERKGWVASIGGYERLFGRITSQTVEATLDAAGVTRGYRVLDVCTGHGVLASAAAERGATVCGLDFADEVVAVARRNVPGVEFRQGDAQELPYPDASFDAVVCGYGVIHVPEPDRALAEMCRVLKPAGRVAISVWERPAPTNGFGLLYGAVSEHGRMDTPLPHGPDFFQFSDPESMRVALSEAGLADIKTSAVTQAWKFEGPGDLLDAILQGAVRARALLEAQDARAVGHPGRGRTGSGTLRSRRGRVSRPDAGPCRERRQALSRRRPAIRGHGGALAAVWRRLRQRDVGFQDLTPSLG